MLFRKTNVSITLILLKSMGASVTGLHRGGDSGEEVAEILMTSPYRSGKEKTTSPRFSAIFETYFRFCLRRWVGFLLVYSRHWQLL